LKWADAIVEEAKGRGTCVVAHVYTDEGVRRCLQAGVRSIEYANFISEETIAMMARQGDLTLARGDRKRRYTPDQIRIAWKIPAEKGWLRSQPRYDRPDVDRGLAMACACRLGSRCT
jgi:imidazolonepropionase-like amidohydrolase